MGQWLLTALLGRGSPEARAWSRDGHREGRARQLRVQALSLDVRVPPEILLWNSSVENLVPVMVFEDGLLGSN